MEKCFRSYNSHIKPKFDNNLKCTDRNNDEMLNKTFLKKKGGKSILELSTGQCVCVRVCLCVCDFVIFVKFFMFFINCVMIFILSV